MNILQNELVLKYFRHCQSDVCGCANWTDTIAGEVIEAMQHPIKKGERYLCLQVGTENIYVLKEEVVDRDEPIHPYYLRLPDAFQKQECDHRPECRDCGKAFPKPAPTSERTHPYVWKGEDKPTEKCPSHLPDECWKYPTCPNYKPKDAGLANGWKPKYATEKCDGEHHGKPCPELHPEKPKDTTEKCQFCGSPDAQGEDVHQCSDGGRGMRQAWEKIDQDIRERLWRL